jgi:hypothetical protein
LNTTRAHPNAFPKALRCRGNVRERRWWDGVPLPAADRVPENRAVPPARYVRNTADGMIIERDVAVSVRGSVTVYANVFRAADERPGHR